MNSIIVYMKYHLVFMNFVQLVELLSECVRLRLDGIICGSPVGLRPARAAWWDKKAQLVRARPDVRSGGCMSTRAIPCSSVAKAPVDKRVANILATPGKIQTAPPSTFKSLVRHEILPCVVFMDKQDARALHGTTKHLLWLTHAGVIPCVKTNDISRICSKNGISRISSKNWYLEKDER